MSLKLYFQLTILWVSLFSISQQNALPNLVHRFLFDYSNGGTHPKDVKTCGYESCPMGKPNMINVHMVSHTHDDVGWLETVDEYFYYTVQFILDTTEIELKADRKKKFIYVEIAFFDRWWREQTDDNKKTIRSLVDKGQLEFILGAWSMNDEASTHYNSIIDQQSLGLRFLLENFGECGRPKIAWQIDPFGHSKEQASLFAQFGFDGLFFARLDYQDYEKRKKDKRLESMWLASDSLGDQSSLFTGALYNMSYSPPPTFCFECNDQPIRDDPRLDDYNVQSRVKTFTDMAIEQAKHFTTNHLIWTMGSDFHYSNAKKNFKNIDKLMHYVNQQQINGSKVNAFYSTPSCYLYSLNRANRTYSVQNDDFFPYAHRPHGFWTGYFTSRPTLKSYERIANNFLQVCKQLQVLANLGQENNHQSKVDNLKEALGVLQHHDAVSGTSKQHVANNYAKMLHKGISLCQDVIKDSLNTFMNPKEAAAKLDIQYCSLLNVSFCSITENSEKFAIVAYNPIARTVSKYIRVPVIQNNRTSFIVVDKGNKFIPSQLVPVSDETRSLPDHIGSKATHDLVFKSESPPLGYITYFVTRIKTQESFSYQKFSQASSSPVLIKNKHIGLSFDADTGLLMSYHNYERNFSVPLSQSLKFYNSHPGDNDQDINIASGAYIFRPNEQMSFPIAKGKVEMKYIQGELVQEVHQKFNDWASQVFRLYTDSKHVEVEWTVGPIPKKDRNGIEVITSYETHFKSNSVFYTDANGRQMVQRKRNYRSTWTLNQTEPIAGNYYPVNSRIYLQDTTSDLQMTLLTDRSQGGSSILDGQLELMVHRRLFYDDALGVGEDLDEPGLDGKGLVVRGIHYLFIDTKNGPSANWHRPTAQNLFMSPYVGFVSTSLTSAQFFQKYNSQWTSMNTTGLPKNVHLLTLEDWHSQSKLLRLEHYFEKNESPLGQNVQISLKDLFKTFRIESIEEQTLGGNQKLEEAKRLEWNVEGHGKTSSRMSSFVIPVNPKDMIVELKPMQIRTFLIKTAI